MKSKILTLINYITQAEYILFNPYVDQGNNLVWSILKLRLKTRKICTLNSFQKAINEELQIMEQTYFKLTGKIVQDMYILIYGYHGFKIQVFLIEKRN